MDALTEVARERLWPMVSEWGQARLVGSDLVRVDAAIAGFYVHDVNWHLLRARWLVPGSRVDVSSGVYWGPLGPAGKTAPRSVLAFCGMETRLRLAADLSTPVGSLDLMAGDWEQSVRDAVFATRRLPVGDHRAQGETVSITEARVLLERQAAEMRETDHVHEWWNDPLSRRRECTRCGVEFRPYDHEHEWSEWRGQVECQICGVGGDAV